MTNSFTIGREMACRDRRPTRGQRYILVPGWLSHNGMTLVDQTLRVLRSFNPTLNQSRVPELLCSRFPSSDHKLLIHRLPFTCFIFGTNKTMLYNTANTLSDRRARKQMLGSSRASNYFHRFIPTRKSLFTGKNVFII